jgi:hypothetical protein
MPVGFVIYCQTIPLTYILPVLAPPANAQLTQSSLCFFLDGYYGISLLLIDVFEYIQYILQSIP